MATKNNNVLFSAEEARKSCKLFCKFLETYFVTQAAAAKSLKCCVFTISRLKNGKHTMSIPIAKRIEEISKGEYKAADLLPWIYNKKGG